MWLSWLSFKVETENFVPLCLLSSINPIHYSLNQDIRIFQQRPETHCQYIWLVKHRYEVLRNKKPKSKTWIPGFLFSFKSTTVLIENFGFQYPARKEIISILWTLNSLSSTINLTKCKCFIAALAALYLHMWVIDSPLFRVIDANSFFQCKFYRVSNGRLEHNGLKPQWIGRKT